MSDLDVVAFDRRFKAPAFIRKRLKFRRLYADRITLGPMDRAKQDEREWPWRAFTALLRSANFIFLLFLLCRSLVFTSSGDGAASEPPIEPVSTVLTSILQIRELPLDEARTHLPVHLNGVVTYCDLGWNLLFVQDATGGVYVQTDQGMDGLSGSSVELDGVTDQGRYATFVARGRIKVRGASAWPNPAPATYAQLMGGGFDSQWVQVTGTVLSTGNLDGRATIGVNLDGHELKVIINGSPSQQDSELFDAIVVVRGVCTVQSDDQMHVKDVRLFTPSPELITIRQKGQPSEFAIARQPIKDLVDGVFQTGRVVRIQGVVTNWSPGHSFSVHDGSGSIRIQTTQTSRLKNEMLVDVVGKLVGGDRTPRLQDARFRRLGIGLPTPPEQLQKPERASLSGPNLRVLNHVEMVRLLDEKEAAKGYPVSIRGVVTYYDQEGNDCFVQDGTAGIWIDTLSTREQGLDLRAGDIVEVESYSAPGYAPSLTRPRFQIKGRGPLPNREVLGLAHLLTGREDGQWVRIIGLARAVELMDEKLIVKLEMGNGGILKAIVSEKVEPKQSSQWIGASLQVEGVCATLFNHKQQLIGVQLLVPTTNQLQVISPSTADPATLPLVSIRDLFKFQARNQTERRVRVRGVVMLVRSGKSLFMHDSSDGLYVEPQNDVTFQPGDAIEAVGFPSIGDFVPVLQNAFCVRTGRGTLPPVSSPTFSDIADGKFDSELISLEAIYLDQTDRGNDLVLTMRVGQRVFDAYLPNLMTKKPFQGLRQGTLLRLTGVCSVQVDENRQPKSFRLLLRSPADVEVRQTPKAWILSYAYRLVGALTAASVAAFCWAAMLRKRVRRQKQLIRQKVIEEAALEAKYRDLFENANDLVFRIDLTGKWLGLNSAVERVLGASRSEISSRSFFDVIAESDRKRVEKMIENLAAGGQGGVEEINVIDTQGKVVTLEVNARIRPNGEMPPHLDVIARNITDRKRAEAELHKAQSKLVQSSRLAGMAEVATSVLHNVGNILNSVNVSATLVGEQIRQSKALKVKRVADLMLCHLGEIGDFMSHDPKGQKLPSYLNTLGDHLTQENAVLLKEVASLQMNIEHIKGIVGRQQEYARVSGILETVKIEDVMEHALQMNAASLARHGVQVIREYMPNLPEIMVEKHKVLQILVNLICNAQQACDALGRPEKRIILRAKGGQKGITLQLTDNGVGIAPENLAQIFNHGFTTRKDGHGFGLHSGAIAAREMGGSLAVHSDGPGLGATFTLELPLRPPRDEPQARGSVRTTFNLDQFENDVEPEAQNVSAKG